MTTINGFVAPGFEGVQDAFAQNFAQGLESGASICLMKDGECVVDIWAGTKDKRRQEPWEQDTLVPVFSTTKAIAALVIAWLYEHGRLDYDQSVASLWPEFAQNGKGDITISQALSHQAGLSGLTEPIEPYDWYNPDLICEKLAAQAPIWPPGSASGYHPLTFGFLAGEIARRADKHHRTIGTILREDLCAPNDIDFYIGTPESEHARCADLHKPRALPDLGDMNAASKAAFGMPWSSPGGRGTAAWRKAELAGANGHGTARALAALMALALDGTLNGQQYLSQRTIMALSSEQISGPDLVLPFDLTFANGIMLNHPNHFYGPEDLTLGHSGWGGSCAFADRANKITFAYVMNKQSHILIGDPRPLAIIDAIYTA
ncbi:MAG TPA: class A beta-lactamase-related serine hydrolase [Hellea balneolensis]|uniref:Class A beta-lactamase-related serine hydrolase n=1 Tax=Hellea balneolensis TaxID=287478 RepID=A0A7C5R0I7_9PROT|nr:class A beta-lactamase-related serine hydrolase [Hellea balneolensis]